MSLLQHKAAIAHYNRCMTIMIIGSPQEAHAAHIFTKVRERNQPAFYFDTRQFPSQLQLGLFIRSGKSEEERFGGRIKDSESGLDIPITEIEATYWRYHFGTAIPGSITDDYQRAMAQREIESAIGSFFRSLPCRWYNSPEAIAMHVFKPYQTQCMVDLGIRVPQTLITNDPDSVVDFYKQMNGKVIYKPVRGGAHTSQLKEQDLTPERLTELAKAPVQFQEMIDGIDIRVYWMAGESFAAEIHSGTLDFRDNPKAEILPVELPDTIQQQCSNAASALLLKYSGIDIRRTPEGEYVFLECNPCPMFIHFERKTGYPISDRLVDMLLGQVVS